MPKTRTATDPKPHVIKQTSLRVNASTDLISFLSASLSDRKRKTILSLLKHRQVSVDRTVVTQYNHPLKPGQQITINWSKVVQGGKHKGVKIVFEDPYLFVIDKPPGLLSIATDKEKEHTALRILSDQVKDIDPRNRIFVVHRLDREVSGLMLFARSKDVQHRLQGAWQKDVLERRYVAVVEGQVAQEQGTITSWLKENQARIVYSSPTPQDGQRAVTHYRVLKKCARFSLLEVTLETGRKNQIRVHMKDMGHPVAGDKKYGATLKIIPRLGLHARILAFRHPISGEHLHFETPIPPLFLHLFTE